MEKQAQTLEDVVKDLVKEHEQKLHSGYGGDLIGQLKHIIREYERNTADALMDAQHFQTDMARWLQGLAICAQMVSSAGTHSEKDARMRGLIEVIESALGKVKDYDYRLDRFNRRSYRPEHLFANDYPVRHYKERAEQAERDLKELTKSLIEKPAPLSPRQLEALRILNRTGERPSAHGWGWEESRDVVNSLIERKLLDETEGEELILNQAGRAVLDFIDSQTVNRSPF